MTLKLCEKYVDVNINWTYYSPNSLLKQGTSGSGNNSVRLQLQGTPYEPLRSVPLDREGEFTFVLRPRKSTVSDRLLVEIRVKDNIKIVTIRSTYLVQNRTLYPLELVMVDRTTGKPVQAVQKIGAIQHFEFFLHRIYPGI